MGFYSNTATTAAPRSSRTRGTAHPRFSPARLGHRSYSPALGKWISRDPGGTHGGWNLYVFVRNRATSLYDILGLQDPEMAIGLSLGFGWDSERGLHISTLSVGGGVSQGLCDNLRVRGDVQVRLYSGGLGLPSGEAQQRDSRWGCDLTASLSGTIGRGTGNPTPSYTLNYYTRSQISDVFYESFTYGQAWNYNSAVGGTRVGFLGFRHDDFYMQYYNDLGRFPNWGGGTDWSWTGGGVMGIYIGGNETAEIGFQDFTGSFDRQANRRWYPPGSGSDGYYLQTKDQLRLNRAEWYLRYRQPSGAITFSISSPTFFNIQTRIHDAAFPFWGPLGSEESARFEYPSFRYGISFEGEVQSKY